MLQSDFPRTPGGLIHLLRWLYQQSHCHPYIYVVNFLGAETLLKCFESIDSKDVIHNAQQYINLAEIL